MNLLLITSKSILIIKKARISLLGGEPMLYKQWDSLLNTIYDIGFIPKIITNLAVNTKTLEENKKS